MKQKQENDSKSGGKGKSEPKKVENKEMSKLKMGEEGGLTLKGFNDFKQGDIVECYTLVPKEKKFKYRPGLEKFF